MNKNFKKVVIVCGHYGSGKTNFAVNLALHLKTAGNRVAVCDLDIVNPYFRAADAKKVLEDKDIFCLIPEFANSNVDIPSVPGELNSFFMEDSPYDYAIIDVGGDEGAVVLGMYQSRIIEQGYDMIYVVNQFRPLTADPSDAADLLHDIESVSRLKCTDVVNNSNLGVETTSEDVIDSDGYADEVCAKTYLPLLCTSYIATDSVKIDCADRDYFPMTNATKQIF